MIGPSCCSDKKGGKMYGEGSEASNSVFPLACFDSLHLPGQGRALTFS